MLPVNEIYFGDCLDWFPLIEDDSIDLTVTSPPYDNLRTYKNECVFKFEPIAKELYRVTKTGGVVVWVVGDATIKGSETGTSFKQALYFKEIGFNLHDTMIYEKAGNLPTSNRYVQIFEYMFVLAKDKIRTYNLIKDKINKWAGQFTFGRTSFRNKDGSLEVVGGKRIVNKNGCRLNIWRYVNGYGFGQSDKIAYKHPATFPEQLAYDHIISWSNENDLILDPMCGSGTTCVMAKKANRNYIGIEMVEEYYTIAKKRVEV